MRVIETKLYTVDELSEAAIDYAYERWHEQAEYYWAGDNIESLKKFYEEFNLYSSGRYWSSVDTGRIDDDILNLQGVRAAKWLLNNYFWTLYERKPLGKYKRRSRCQLVETCCPFTGYYMDEELLMPIRRFISQPDNSTVEDILLECVESWKRQFDADEEYCSSMEYFMDECRANEYEFTENGRRC